MDIFPGITIESTEWTCFIWNIEDFFILNLNTQAGMCAYLHQVWEIDGIISVQMSIGCSEIQNVFVSGGSRFYFARFYASINLQQGNNCFNLICLNWNQQWTTSLTKTERNCKKIHEQNSCWIRILDILHLKMLLPTHKLRSNCENFIMSYASGS